jgi:drug/metabolite transporter (DMT)-like permease
MTAALLALAASVGWGIADFLGGLKSRTIPLLAVLALAQPIGLALIAIVVLIGGVGEWRSAVLWAIPAAVLGSVGIAAFYRGMATGTISIVAPIAATGVLIPVVVGIATGDRPSALQLVGFPLAIGGAVIASRETGPALGRGRIAAGVPWALVAAVTFGGYFIPMSVAADADVLWAALVFKVSAASLLIAAFAAVRPRVVGLGRNDVVAITAIGIADSSANVFFAAAAAVGLVSVVSVLASLYPVVTVALAWIVLHERMSPIQRAGVFAALAGVVLISAG